MKIYQAFDKADYAEGNLDLCDNISEILTRLKSVEERKIALMNYGIEKEIAQELSKVSGFTEYHSLSKKAMDLIMGDLWATDKNQMQIFYDAGMTEVNKNDYIGEEIKFDGSDWIVSPITKRAVAESVKVINAARKLVRRKYGQEFSHIIIEMAREKNSAEEKQNKQKIQRINEERGNAIRELTLGKKITPRQFEIIGLLKEQDMKCAYSGKSVSLTQVYENMLEVDHIIPRSLSFDNSRNNKVAVLVSENQKKGQRTPFQYLNSGAGAITYADYKAMVLKNNSYSARKKANLLYEEAPEKELRGFINRNLVDTRYACREVLNMLQNYFNRDSMRGLVGILQYVVKGSLVVEGIGALGYACRFIPQFGLLRGIWYAVFHSISAFCNAGVDLLGDSSFAMYADDVLINTVTAFLIIAGGIGFMVWRELVAFIKKAAKKETGIRQGLRKLSLHTKLVLLMTISLLLGGTLFFFIFKHSFPYQICDNSFHRIICCVMLFIHIIHTVSVLYNLLNINISVNIFDLIYVP